MPAPSVVAVLVSDIHLSLKVPVARSAEPDWLAAQARQLKELDVVAAKHKAPIICAGDAFDRWNSPPELINWALDHLPEMYAIPGQHDLPLHNYKDIHKSAYWTMVRAGRIWDMKPDGGIWPSYNPEEAGDFCVWAYPWGFDVKPRISTVPGKINVAVVHAYIWAQGKGYPDAPEEKRVGAYTKALAGFDAAVFGDNHIPFIAQAGSCTVFNHGTFFRRRSDERNHRPALGLLMSDGTVRRHEMDCSKDLFIDSAQEKFIEDAGFKMDEFLGELNKLGDAESDYRAALQHYFETREISPGAQRIILEALKA